MATLCFDLEGTLLDPIEGFEASLRQACLEFGLPCPAREDLAPRMGLDLDPWFQTFPRLSGQEFREAFTVRFWNHFGEEGVFSQKIHPGLPLMLARLKRQDHHLFLLTGYPAALARRALHHFDLNLVFEDVVGTALPGAWKPKSELLKVLALDGALQSGGWMIGDRADDVRGGKAHGLKTIGLACGFGTRTELAGAEADVLLDSIQELDGQMAELFTGPEVNDPFSRSE